MVVILPSLEASALGSGLTPTVFTANSGRCGNSFRNWSVRSIA
jgi:hypothetical protein